MTVISIAPLAELQLQSPLLTLPTEIKHQIYGLCFTADDPIVNPFTSLNRIESKNIPKLCVALLQTCRRVYHEADRRPLYYRNTFRFTTVDRARAFFKALDRDHRSSIHDLEIDIREFHSDQPSLAHEWLQYLTWDIGPLGKPIGSLYMDAPALKTLRLNFEAWPKVPLYRNELWNLLKHMVSNVQGLERIVVTGASKGKGMARRDPWSLAHFVGADDVDGDLVSRMWNCVEASANDKVIRWFRTNGRLHLEVVSRIHLLKHVDCYWSGPSSRKTSLEPWPENGSCLWFEYENRRPNVDPTTTILSPSAAV